MESKIDIVRDKGIYVHKDIWHGLRPFMIYASIHFLATILCIIEISLTILFSLEIINILGTIKGAGSTPIIYVIYISEISLILVYSIYSFLHREGN